MISSLKVLHYTNETKSVKDSYLQLCFECVCIDSPAMASCIDGLPPHSPHGWCQAGSWVHHTQTL